MLRKNFFTSEEIERIVTDYRSAGLEPEEVDIMTFARKVITNSHAIQEDDFQILRNHGLGDDEIFDIILTAAARSFFAKTLDAAGVQPDKAYLESVGDLVQVLSVGRPYEEADT